MNDTLKVAGRIGAELGAAKAENDRLREALRWYEEKVAECRKIGSLGDNARQALDRDGGFRARDALSQQPEPTDTFTAVDMATAAAQGFRDGQAAVEPATAQDEPVAKTVPIPADIARAIAWGEHWDVLEAIGSLRCLLADSEGDDDIAFPDSPAQTEQQPVRLPQRKNLDGLLDPASKRAGMAYNEALEDVELLNTPPIAQTAPQPEQSGKFAMHQRVRKTSGSEWQGRICGTYSTALTPEGYAVESEAHAGSVQIYPAKALEAVE